MAGSYGTGDKIELKKELKILNIKVLGNYVCKSDIKKALAVDTDPNLKAPKKWWNKMYKKMMDQGYDDETARKSVGKIWSDLSTAKKKEIRKREGKTYAPAK